MVADDSATGSSVVSCLAVDDLLGNQAAFQKGGIVDQAREAAAAPRVAN